MGSLLLSPGSWCVQGFVCALQESVSPVFCMFWHLYGGVNGNLLQEGLCHTQGCCTQSPWPCGSPLLTRTSAGDIQTLNGTHGQVWVSLLWGHCSSLLGPGAHKVLFVPSKTLLPQYCVSSGGSMMGLMVTSSMRAYATPRSAAPRAPGHC